MTPFTTLSTAARARGLAIPALSIRAIVLIACGVLALYLVLLRFEVRHGRAWTHDWVSDDSDREVYYEIARVVPGQTPPYANVRSEYPTLATLAFVIPFIGTSPSALTSGEYGFRWSALMAVVLIATIFLIARFRYRHRLQPAAALLLLLPSPLFFSLMRFDILCSALVCVSLAAFAHRRYAAAHAVLATATLVKWYPAVLFPVYVAYHLAHEPRRSFSPAALLRTHTARYTAIYIALVTAIIAATIALFTWHGFLFAYRFHAARGGQFLNPYWIVERYAGTPGVVASAPQWVNLIFLALQLAIVPILLRKRVPRVLDVFRYSVLGIYLFITFARIDSPQWILWYLAPILMVARDTRTLVTAAMLATWNYAVFPIGLHAFDDGRGFASVPFSMIVLVKDVVLIALIVFVFRDRGPEGWGSRE